jgi:hypothetical protein
LPQPRGVGMWSDPYPLVADAGRYFATSVMRDFPSPSMGEGAGGGEDRTSSLPSPPSPAKGGRGLDLPLSACQGEE